MAAGKHASSAPHEIYATSFAPLQQGYALWIPEPQAHGEPQIGDVGFFVDGAFHRLFNIDTSDPSKQVTTWPVAFPDNHTLPLDSLQTWSTPRILIPKAYRTHGVDSVATSGGASVAVGGANVGLSAKYSCTESHGAVLLLKSDADRVQLYNNKLVKTYIMRHHSRWVAYARDTLHLGVKEEDIVFICGTIKTKADWASATFNSTTRSCSCSLSGGGAALANVNVGCSHTASAASPDMERQGEYYIRKTGHPPLGKRKKDQSIFLLCYKMRRWMGVLKNMSAAADYYKDPSWRGWRRSAQKGAVSVDVEEYYPDEEECVVRLVSYRAAIA
ncbi:hypothetical protein PsYK624_104450 [Phanerochaete sordida]|uniref:Uncharacterized protein n=1 Tax=Phanerochaete sordida TaxID=48140 RepID=A0A9P3GGB7_9APHY|nr:hypothetical protein PsYK624_104450 [Phanerochaete sordida]